MPLKVTDTLPSIGTPLFRFVAGGFFLFTLVTNIINIVSWATPARHLPAPLVAVKRLTDTRSTLIAAMWVVISIVVLRRVF